MKLAYLIIAHRVPDQLAILVNILLVKENHVFIHLDSDSKQDFSAIYQLELIEERLHVLKDRFHVKWGGFSLTLAVITLLNACYEEGSKFDYVFTLSGQDFPLVPLGVVEEFLSRNKGFEFVEYNVLPYYGWNDGGSDRFDFFWLVDELGFSASSAFVEQQRIEGIKRTPPDKLATHGGSCWMTITFELLQYICNVIQREWNTIYSFFRYTFISDEILIQSIILNSPFATRIINNNLRFIDWNSGPDYPKTLTTSDLEFAFNSGNFFARKIDLSIDDEILIKIKKNIIPVTTS